MNSEAQQFELAAGNGWTATALPRLMRGLGAAVVVISISAFLFQGWEAGNDLQRYLMLLAQTVLLAITGLACSHLLHENKGARTFLILALAAVPVNFTIIGALLHSQLLPGMAAELPAVALWRAVDSGTTLLTGALALPILGVVTLLGFMVLARSSSKPLAFAFFGANALLLIPSRDPTLMAAVALTAVVAGAFVVGRLAGDSALRTLEGRIARTLPFIPVAILFGRNLWLHEADTFLITGGFVALFAALRTITLPLPRGANRSLLEYLSLFPAALAAFGSGHLAAELLRAGDATALAVTSLAFAALAFELSLRAVEGPVFRRLGAGALTAGLIADLLLFGGLGTALLCVVAGGAVLLYGFAARQRSLLYLGGICALAGLVYQVAELVAFFHVGSWSALAGAGVAAIVAGSLIERHGARLRARTGEWRERLAEWDR